MKSIWTLVLAAILGSLITLGIHHFIFYAEGNTANRNIDWSISDNPPASLTRAFEQLPTSLPDFTAVAEMAVDAVVHIQTEQTRRTAQSPDFFGMPDHFRDFFFGPMPRDGGQPRPIVGTGSGVIIASDGYVITNNHVIENAEKIQVTLNDRRVYEATVVGKDPNTDLALLKIEEKNLPYLSFGNSDQVRVGEWVLAIGNPFNLNSTITAGIVSAKNRNINILGGEFSIESFIQTDAAVNRGNSGGALINTRGELIGINTAIASQTGGFAGYSFAVPSNIANKVIEDIKEFGQVQRGMLGVSIRELNSREAQEKGMEVFRGAYVEQVVAGGAAEEAGLKPGDLIVGINDAKITNPTELIENVAKKRPGDQINVKYIRNGRQQEVRAKLKNVFGEYTVVTPERKQRSDQIGASFEVVPKEELSRLNIRNGVRVASVSRTEGLFRSAGIRPGFIITAIDRQPVSTPQELNQILNEKSGGILIEGVYPNGQRAFYGMGLS
ncbi:MAG TPA: Do family serine endopeptidase [Bacteroidales bacterium]|nr:Do family serine endopeptidase [Bacteroidales bacterium]